MDPPVCEFFAGSSTRLDQFVASLLLKALHYRRWCLVWTMYFPSLSTMCLEHDEGKGSHAKGKITWSNNGIKGSGLSSWKLQLSGWRRFPLVASYGHRTTTRRWDSLLCTNSKVISMIAFPTARKQSRIWKLHVHSSTPFPPLPYSVFLTTKVCSWVKSSSAEIICLKCSLSLEKPAKREPSESLSSIFLRSISLYAVTPFGWLL